MSSRVKMLRQRVEDYNKRYNAGLNKENAGYNEEYAAYQAQVNAYNDAITAINNLRDRELFVAADGGYYKKTSGPEGVGSVRIPFLTQAQIDRGDLGYSLVNGVVKYGNTRVPVHVYPALAAGVPAAPPAPSEENIKVPPLGLTLKQEHELVAPSASPVELERGANVGFLRKSELADNPAAPTEKNSAFFNLKGDDPNGLKDSGILARTIAGQL